MDMASEQFLPGLKALDPDRYLSTLYAPPEKREALAVLYTFNAEIAAVRDRVREPLPGEIRLQWWRDIVEAQTPASGHPLAEALLAVIAQEQLPPNAFSNMLEARIFDLYNDPMPSRNDLEGYCGETASAVIQLAAQILDRQAAPAFAETAGHAGCAQAIVGLIRLLPMHRSRGQCFVPADILSAAGCTVEELLAGAPPAASAVEAMAALASQHLTTFEESASRLPQTLRPAYLPLAVTGIYRDRIVRSPMSALTQPVPVSLLRRQFRLLVRAARGW
ncbi:phytoene/squalene synthase family protein [Mesorhizobium sp. NBSH29]|uniref:phytoene/squalene synthase family protein n=1 Tax=Mesorhizobium sp. NBSH29 TaxID=2654249 RepID=UPI0035BC2677